MSDKRDNFLLAMLLAPALLVFCAFFLLPIGRLALAAGSGPDGIMAYAAMYVTPIILVFVILQRRIVSGLTSGALK